MQKVSQINLLHLPPKGLVVIVVVIVVVILSGA